MGWKWIECDLCGQETRTLDLADGVICEACGTPPDGLMAKHVWVFDEAVDDEVKMYRYGQVMAQLEGTQRHAFKIAAYGKLYGNSVRARQIINESERERRRKGPGFEFL